MWRGVVSVMMMGGLGLACGGRYERDPRESGVAEVGGNAEIPGGGAGAGGLGNVAGGGGLAATSGTGGTSDARMCNEQRHDYERYYAEVMAEFEDFPCEADEDCRAYYARSPCEPGCRLITSAANRGIIDRLNMFGTFNCDEACFPETISCPKAPPVHCIARQCQ